MHESTDATDAQRGHLTKVEMTEQLLSMTDSPQGPGVYALQLQVSPDDLHDHIGHWQAAGYESWPNESLPTVATSDGLLYVGDTHTLQQRLAQHVAGEGATWTTVYPPGNIARIWPYPSSDDAAVMQRQHALDLHQEFPSAAVVCDGEVVG